MRNLSLAACVLLVGALGACGGPQGDVTVAIAAHVAQPGPSALSAIGPVAVSVADLSEAGGTGVLPGRTGERKTLGDLSLGLITVTPTPGAIVAEALRAELAAAGAKLVAPGAGAAAITGAIRQFSVRTDVTAFYWDIVGTTAATVTATRDGRSHSSDYAATCKDRTYVYPTGLLIGQVVRACVGDLARQFRNDAAMARLLGG